MGALNLIFPKSIAAIISSLPRTVILQTDNLMPVTSNFCKILAQLTAKLPQINTGAQGAATRGAGSATDSPGCDSSFFQNTLSTFLLQIKVNSCQDLVVSHLSRDSTPARTTCNKSRWPQAASPAPLGLRQGRERRSLEPRASCGHSWATLCPSPWAGIPGLSPW